MKPLDTSTRSLLLDERTFMLDAAVKMLENLATAARLEATALKKSADNELVNVLTLESMVGGLRVAIIKISTLSHVLKLIDGRPMDSQPLGEK